MRNLFATITKVDAQEGLVYGRLTQEVADKSGETLDYEGSKPLFEAWSAEASKATDGKSLGNLREMHQLKAVGKLTQIDFVDGDQAIDICAKVVDQSALDKCIEGIYTGFSVGGRLAKRWTEGDVTKIIIDPAEASLVDNPCVPTAHFSYIKTAGADPEERKFKLWEPNANLVASKAAQMAVAEGRNEAVWAEFVHKAREALIAQHAAEAVGDGIEIVYKNFTTEEVAAFGEDWTDDLDEWDLLATDEADKAAKEKPKGDYGDVDYADPGYQKDGKPRYPIDTAAHIRAAWNYINKDKNQEPYSSDEVSKIKNKIIAAWKDKIDADGPPSAKKDDGKAEVPEWTQVWQTRDGKTFAKKADAMAHAGEVRAQGTALAQALEAQPAAEGDLVPWPHVPELGKAVAAYKAVREAFADHVVVKGLYSVSRLAEMCEELSWLVVSCGYEAEAEGDQSPIPAELAQCLKDLCQSLCNMCVEETTELIAALSARGIAIEVVPGDTVIVEMVNDAQVLKAGEAVYKAGARNAKADQDRLQAAHDAIAACGADCDPDNLPEVEHKAAGGDLADELAVTKAQLATMEKQSETAAKTLTDLTKAVADAQAEIEKLKALPAPDLRLVEKGGGGGDADPEAALKTWLSGINPDQRGQALADLAIRLSQRAPYVVGGRSAA